MVSVVWRHPICGWHMYGEHDDVQRMHGGHARNVEPSEVGAAQESNPVPGFDLQMPIEGGMPTVQPHFKAMETAPPWACETHSPISRMQGTLPRLHPVGAKGDCVMREILNGIGSLAKCGWATPCLCGLDFNVGPHRPDQHEGANHFIRYVMKAPA